MADFTITRNVADQSSHRATLVTDNGHPCTITVSPYADGDALATVNAYFDVSPPPGMDTGTDVEAEERFAKAVLIEEVLRDAAEPLVERIVGGLGAGEDAVREILRVTIGLALSREVSPAEVTDAIAATQVAFEEQSEAYLRSLSDARDMEEAALSGFRP